MATMSVENLDKIFHPKSIAVVGASERKGSVGAALMYNLIERGFPGEIYPINSYHKKIGKLSAHPSIRDLEAPVDLAVIATPITSAPQIVKDCVDVGIGGAVIISAGGKEIGEQGKKLIEGLTRAIPMRRLGQPADYPGIIAFLASSDADYITGQTISVSGGLTMHG